MNSTDCILSDQSAAPSPANRFSDAMAICHALALLMSQTDAASDYMQCMSVLARLKACWTKGHLNCDIICTVEHCTNFVRVPAAGEFQHEPLPVVLSELDRVPPCDGISLTKNAPAVSEANTLLETVCQVVKEEIFEQTYLNANPTPSTLQTDGQVKGQHKAKNKADKLPGGKSKRPRHENSTPTVSKNSSTSSKDSSVADSKTSSSSSVPVSDGEGFSVCTICNRRLTSQSWLVSHMRRVHGIICEKSKSDSDAGCVCATCGRHFRFQHLLKTHSVIHTGARPYPCRYPGCDKRFGQSSTRNQHECRHSDSRPNICNHCGLGFKLKNILYAHLKTVHSAAVGVVPQHQCSKCDKSFILVGALRAHQRLAHSNERPYVCPECLKSFKSRQMLKRHHNGVHTHESLVTCPVCERQFTQMVNLRTHMRTHTGEKPYACSLCGMQFSYSGTLKSHLASHRKDGCL